MPEHVRPAWLEVDLEAIERNLAETQRRVGPGRNVIASIKGNAYGLGVVGVAQSLERQGVYALWTGNIDEGIALRAAGIATKIIMFGGYLPEQIDELVEHDLIPTIYDTSGLTAAAEAGRKRGRAVAVYIKVDSGLGRLGVSVGDAGEFVAAVEAAKDVRLEGVYTHLPFGNAQGKAWALERYEHFTGLLDDMRRRGIVPDVTQVWGSSGVLAALPDRCNAVCVGHILFGLTPLTDDAAASDGYVPAVKALKASLIHVGHHPSGSDLAIGGAYRSRNARTTGVVAFGVGDGMRRPMAGQTMSALVRGQRVPIIGTSLEHTVLDLDVVDMPRVGEEVTLIGEMGAEQISLSDWAGWLGCTPLEVIMSFSGRLATKYVNSADSIWGAFRN
jgi:alanine racemase